MENVYNLWEKTPGMCEEIPTITVYQPKEKKSDAAVVILPGGGYAGRAPHEGEGYAEFLNENGITAFVCAYRVSPHRFPLELLDSRRAVRYVRYYADKFGIDKNKVAIMGSSAGGHLAALTSTYFDKIDFEGIDEIDKEDFIPNKQILCYPVIKLLGKGISHLGSGKNLLGDLLPDMGEELSPDLIVSEKTPDAFMWHTFEDNCVNVINTLDYARALRMEDKRAEVHIFPDGGHGMGLCRNNGQPASKDDKVGYHVSGWGPLMIEWLRYIDYLD